MIVPRSNLAFLLACLVACGLMLAEGEACTPAQVAAVPPAERALCVVLRATTPELGEVCATADELAPLVPELLAARADGDGGAPSSLVVAYKMPPPRARRAPRRRCGQWISLVDGGSDGAADAGR